MDIEIQEELMRSGGQSRRSGHTFSESGSSTSKVNQIPYSSGLSTPSRKRDEKANSKADLGEMSEAERQFRLSCQNANRPLVKRFA